MTLSRSAILSLCLAVTTIGDAPMALPAAEPASTHWAFGPLESAVPRVASDWAESPIDHAIATRWAQQQLTPAPDSEKPQLLRRLHFDLVGLPPTPEQLATFLADDKPRALERVVDSLLASPAFGQRWARHWLDVARFAESTGGGRTKIFDNAWRYRDYVIRALNADKPYDQFVAEQVAGDLLPFTSYAQRRDQLIATGFLLLGPINYELQDKELLQMEVIDEQIDTLGQAVLGLAIGCARCHDHKFDPIPTADYYALAGIFKSTHVLLPGNVSGYLERPLYQSATHKEQVSRHGQRVKMLEGQVADLQGQIAALKETSSKAIALADLPGIVVDDTKAKLTGAWTSSTSVAGFVGSRYIHDANAGKGQKTARFEASLPTDGLYEIRISYTPAANRASNVPVTYWHAAGISNATVNQKQRAKLARSFVSLGTHRFKKTDMAIVEIGTAGTDGVVIADSVQWLPAAGTTAKKPAPGRKNGGSSQANTKKIKDLTARLKPLRTRLSELKKTAPPAVGMAMAVEDDKQTADIPIALSGDVHSPGDVVPRGFLSALPGSRTSLPDGQSGRLQLARWLTGPAAPLTARVAANRCWAHLFGRGLVPTTTNFGTTGTPPSHPRLLDHLARHLVDNRWSLKKTIRHIVLSRTYRLTSRPTETARARDAGNKWLSHQRRRRLDAESIRDALLAVSGELEPFDGGPTIKAGTKSEFGYEFDDRRRSIYTPVFRNRLNHLLAVFDVSDPNVVAGDRASSTLPTQALVMMNNPWVIARTRATAQRVMDEAKTTPERIDRLTRLVLGRAPSETEQRLLGAFFDDTMKSENPQAWAAAVQVVFSCLDFRYLQ